ncbi:MAG: type II toxin-antitoxin system RelE/ParE family toxin [Deltaproteobacteria bacterium]|nr:type II toxin-antitoxin system RelE/ParE family toxin [Deltaproteobacteria bacterium]
MSKKLVELVYEGSSYTIRFYVRKSGEVPSREWLESMPESIQKKFAALFMWMGDHGKILNEQKFKHLTGTKQLFEFKADSGRILCFFFSGKQIVLTNGFRKKSNKTPKSAILLAEKLKSEFEGRTEK